MVEVIFNRTLAAPGDEENPFDARLLQFFDDVLNDRLLSDGEHLLRMRLSGWQKSGPHPGYGNYSVSDGHLCSSQAGSANPLRATPRLLPMSGDTRESLSGFPSRARHREGRFVDVTASDTRRCQAECRSAE